MEKSLSPAFIELSLEADTKKQALSLLVEKMYNKGVFTEQELFLEAVLDSEKCSLWILQN
jgi:mannitol/fructose-specific phosphotransferase system IIA component (Ntr-type)